MTDKNDQSRNKQTKVHNPKDNQGSSAKKHQNRDQQNNNTEYVKSYIT